MPPSPLSARTWMRRIAVIVALLALALTLGACSRDDDPDNGAGAVPAGPIESQEPDDIVRAAETALRTAHSVRITGEVQEQGERIALDMRIGRETGAKGTIKRGKATTELIRIGDQLWLRAGRSGPSRSATTSPSRSATAGCSSRRASP